MYCKKCGKEIKDSSRFCEYCGAKVEYSVKDTSGGNKAKNSPGNAGPQKSVIIGVVILAVLLIAGGITGVVCLLEGKKDAAADASVEVTEESADPDKTTETAEESAAPAAPDEAAVAAPPENVRTVQKGDILVTDCMSMCEGEGAYPWRDDGEQLLIMTGNQFNDNLDADEPLHWDRINEKMKEAIGKTVGDTFFLYQNYDNGAYYTYKYTIKEIRRVDQGYEKIMRMYKDIDNAVTRGNDPTPFMDVDLGCNPEFAYPYPSDHTNGVFAVEDINGDGVQELFIARDNYSVDENSGEYIHSFHLYDVYTLRDGEPVLLERAMGKRICDLCEGGILTYTDLCYNDMGEYGCIESWESLPSGGAELKEIESLWYDNPGGSTDGEIRYTHSVRGKETEISKEEAETIENKYPVCKPKYIYMYFDD